MNFLYIVYIIGSTYVCGWVRAPRQWP